MHSLESGESQLTYYNEQRERYEPHPQSDTLRANQAVITLGTSSSAGNACLCHCRLLGCSEYKVLPALYDRRKCTIDSELESGFCISLLSNEYVWRCKVVNISFHDVVHGISRIG